MPVPDQTAAPAPIEVSLVICTMNEADSIAPVIAEAQGALGGLSHEIIIVDDSPDERTADVVRACAAQDSRIRLVRREGVRGLASACIAGWDAAQGQILGVMDGDGQHEAGLLPRMVAALRAELAAARDQVLTGLRAIPGIEAPAPDGGLYAFFRLEGRDDSLALAKALVAEAGLGLAPGAAFGDEGEGWLRWCFAARPEKNAAGLERLAGYLARG